MKKVLLVIIFYLITLNIVKSNSIVSSDPSFSTSACDGRPAIQEWIKQRKQIPFNEKNRVLLVTVSKSFDDDLKRLVNSAEIYDQPYIILGLCQDWNGENLLNQFLENTKKNGKIDINKMLILYTDSNNIFVNAPQKLSDIYSENFPDKSIIFKAERFCYPRIKESQFKSSQRYKFLNSQAFLAPASELLRLFADTPFAETSDSYQLYTQQYFVDAFINHKDKFKMQVDSGRKMFATLFGKDDEDNYQLKTNKNGVNSLIWRAFDSVTNDIADSHPILVGDISASFFDLDFSSVKNEEKHKQGSWIKLQKGDKLTKTNENLIRKEIDAKFNVEILQNFFPSTSSSSPPFSSDSSYSSSLQVKDKNKILIGLFFNDDDIFVRLILEGIESLDYPKENIVIFINNYKKNTKKSNADIEDWIEKIEQLQGTPGNYHSIIKKNEKDVSKAKREALLATSENKCDYYFTTDAVLENVNTLKHLIQEKKRFISPLITLQHSTYSNFWGEINWEKQGYKKHSLYPSIVGKEYVGVFRVPVVWGTFLIHSSLIPQISDNYQINPNSKINWEKVLDKMLAYREDDDWWNDIIFTIKCSFELDDGIWLSNKEHFGLLIDKDEVTPEDTEKMDNENGKVHKELYAYPNNKMLFKRYYYNPQFYDFAVNYKSSSFNYTEPCPDAFAWEFMRPVFGEHMIEEAENYGKWSGGGHTQQYDARIGGTENYPTQDIHLNQFGLHEIWLDIVKTDIANSADELYGGIVTKGYNIAFIVRYKPGAQSFLKPHHDASLYTISFALNKPVRDFQGGGVRYVRKNCTFIPPDAGHAIVHPGRVTHKHEGLETTGGTRYIFVTFVT